MPCTSLWFSSVRHFKSPSAIYSFTTRMCDNRTKFQRTYDIILTKNSKRALRSIGEFGHEKSLEVLYLRSPQFEPRNATRQESRCETLTFLSTCPRIKSVLRSHLQGRRSTWFHCEKLDNEPWRYCSNAERSPSSSSASREAWMWNKGQACEKIKERRSWRSGMTIFLRSKSDKRCKHSEISTSKRGRAVRFMLKIIC